VGVVHTKHEAIARSCWRRQSISDRDFGRNRNYVFVLTREKVHIITRGQQCDGYRKQSS